MVTSDASEYARRVKAIQLHEAGCGWSAILQAVHRSRGWLAKWVHRYRVLGWPGLRTRSREPHRIWRRTARSVVRRILAVRGELAAHQGRRRAFTGIGPDVIQWELVRRRWRKIPSRATIARILARFGQTRAPRSPRGARGGEPYPGPRARRMGDVQQTDLVGPRYLRGPRGVTRFYSFHTVDVAGHTAAGTQARDKQARTLCRHLVLAWRQLGVPAIAQLDNEMAATGGGRYPYSLSQVVRLHLLLGIHLVFIPPGSPGRQASVESFNALWQARVLRRHRCPTLAALRRLDQRFRQDYHYGKPHRALTDRAHGTRLPGVLRDRLWRQLRHVPAAFRLEAFEPVAGRLRLPLAKGCVTWIRQVDAEGRIEANGRAYFIARRLAGQYVQATLFTHRQSLVVKQQGRVVKRVRFPIAEKLVAPLLRSWISRF